MRWTVLKLRHALLFAIAFLCIDGACCQWPGWVPSGWNYVFELAAPLLAAIACAWQVRILTGRAKVLWLLLTAGLTVWIFAMTLAAWEDIVQHAPFETASLSDFAYFFYGVPILFALSTPVEGQRFSLFNWLDGVQAIFAGYLAYLTIFSVLPFSATAPRPLPIGLVELTYNVENAVLAGACLLRLAAFGKGGEERRFYGTLCVFLTTYAVAAGIYNASSVAHDGLTALGFVADAPFVLLALLIVSLPASESEENTIVPRRSPLALFIDNASPIFFTLALLALGIAVLQNHFHTGVAAIAVGLAAYGIRTTVLQVRYIRTQQELQAARDRLEEISLLDGLTEIANRRCFDRTLESEWHRAQRTQHPLSLLLIDLDYFKSLNDTYGHPYGDKCLIQVARALRATAARSGDLVARYGGEEFAAILPATNIEDANAIAARMHEAVAALKISTAAGIDGFLSVSIGIASYGAPEPGSPAALIETSDRALYKAKQNGRNRIERAETQVVAK